MRYTDAAIQTAKGASMLSSAQQLAIPNYPSAAHRPVNLLLPWVLAGLSALPDRANGLTARVRNPRLRCRRPRAARGGHTADTAPRSCTPSRTGRTPSTQPLQVRPAPAARCLLPGDPSPSCAPL